MIKLEQHPCCAANEENPPAQIKGHKLAVEFDLLTPEQAEAHAKIMLSTLTGALPQCDCENLLGVIIALKKSMGKDYIVCYAVQKFVMECIGSMPAHCGDPQQNRFGESWLLPQQLHQALSGPKNPPICSRTGRVLCSRGSPSGQGRGGWPFHDVLAKGRFAQPPWPARP